MYIMCSLLLDFLDRCLKDCLLTNREVVELTNRLFQCCLTFASFMQVKITNIINYVYHIVFLLSVLLTIVKLISFSHTTQDISVTAITKESLPEIKTHEGAFTRDLSSLLGILNEMSRVESERSWGNMITRLDYNSFYSVYT